MKGKTRAFGNNEEITQNLVAAATGANKDNAKGVMGKSATPEERTSPLGRIFCSSSLKAVPILLRTIGGSSPGSRGYSTGSLPVSSCVCRRTFRELG